MACSVVGYILYLIALFAIFLPLGLDVLFYNICGNAAGSQETEALRPEFLLPEKSAYLRELFFDKSAAGRFIGIDKFAYFCIGLSSEEYMDMICVMVPFL